MSTEARHREFVVEAFTVYPEIVVISIHYLDIISQLNLQLLVMSFGQEVNVVIAEPELSTWITKPRFVGSPVSVEVNTAIQSSLKHLHSCKRLGVSCFRQIENYHLGRYLQNIWLFTGIDRHKRKRYCISISQLVRCHMYVSFPIRIKSEACG